MKIWGEQTFAQIGETLGISQNTAASRYRYGLEALKSHLGSARRRGDLSSDRHPAIHTSHPCHTISMNSKPGSTRSAPRGRGEALGTACGHRPRLPAAARPLRRIRGATARIQTRALATDSPPPSSTPRLPTPPILPFPAAASPAHAGTASCFPSPPRSRCSAPPPPCWSPPPGIPGTSPPPTRRPPTPPSTRHRSRTRHLLGFRPRGLRHRPLPCQR